MKKLISLSLVVAILSISVIGCGGGTTTKAGPTGATSTEKKDGDKGATTPK